VTFPSPPLLTVRSTLILLLGALAGIGAGTLTYASNRDLAAAVLAGGGAAAGATVAFHVLIG
jgi:hypothetical protein